MVNRPKSDLHERERARREVVAERQWIVHNEKRFGATDIALPALAVAVLFLI